MRKKISGFLKEFLVLGLVVGGFADGRLNILDFDNVQNMISYFSNNTLSPGRYKLVPNPFKETLIWHTNSAKVNFGPNGNILVSTGGDGKIVIWDTKKWWPPTHTISTEEECYSQGLFSI